MSFNFAHSNLIRFTKIYGKIIMIGLITIGGLPLTGTTQPKVHQLWKEGEKPKKLANVFDFTEGPACDKKGNIYFTDQPNNKIYIWTVDQKLVLFGDHFGRANGTYFDHNGNLITCSDEKNQLWSITPNGKITVLVDNYNGKRLNGPNDLWIAPNGNLYLTDPYYQRPWWNHNQSDLDQEAVYLLPQKGNKLIRVADGLVQPNGIIGTPNGRYLYVADIKDHKTYRYRINVDGTLSDKKLFAAMGSDGMTIDNQGNIYLTGKGVTIFNPKGEQIAQIPIDEPWTANICFGGKDRHLLFITASKAIYGLRMKVKGVN